MKYHRIRLYKYRLVGTVTAALPELAGVVEEKVAVPGFIYFFPNGLLAVIRGYAWDGPSGPTIDTRTAMRASLVHDALYQLIREGKLPRDPTRRLADEIFYRHLREDGMIWVRARYWKWAVRRWARKASFPDPAPEILTAP